MSNNHNAMGQLQNKIDEGSKMKVLLLSWYLTFEFVNMTGAGLQYTANCDQRSHEAIPYYGCRL